MTPTATEQLTRIPLGKLAAHPHNIRKKLGDLTELAKSIEGVGILEPPLVLPAKGGKYTLVTGHRRVAAARKAKGVTDALCIVRDLTEAEVIEAMLVENMQRNDVTPLEEAKAYGRLVELDTTVADIARKVGRSQQHIKGRLGLLVLPDKVLALLDVDSKRDDSPTVTLAGLTALTKYADQADVLDAWYEKVTSTPRGYDHSIRNARSEPGRWASAWCGDRDHGREVAALMAKFEASGLSRWQGKYEYDRPRSYMDSLKTTTLLSVLDLKGGVTAHKAEPCHAVYIEGLDRGKPAMVPVCTSPIRHSVKGPVGTRSKLQMVPSKYKNTTARGGSTNNGPTPKVKKALNAARSEFVTLHLAKTVETAADLAPLLELIDCALDLATGVDPGKLAATHVGAEKDHDAWRAVRAGDLPVARKIAALVLAIMREHDWNVNGSARFCAWLDELGYQPSEDELPFFEQELDKWRKAQPKELASAPEADAGE